jgi:hypothetical protein
VHRGKLIGVMHWLAMMCGPPGIGKNYGHCQPLHLLHQYCLKMLFKYHTKKLQMIPTLPSEPLEVIFGNKLQQPWKIKQIIAISLTQLFSAYFFKRVLYFPPRVFQWKLDIDL